MQQPSYDISRVIRAIEFAAKKHRIQRRKDSDASPYINHPIALMHVLCIDGGIRDPRILAAAALHDTIEDTETTPNELVAEFGPDVADLVVEMTDDKSLPKMERKRIQIEHARHMSRDGALVKLADKICNLRDIAVAPPENWSLERRIRVLRLGEGRCRQIAAREFPSAEDVRGGICEEAHRNELAGGSTG